MAQGRQQNNGSRQRCAQSAAAKAPAEPPKAVCAQLEQMNRKLAAAIGAPLGGADELVRRYDGRMTESWMTCKKKQI